MSRSAEIGHPTGVVLDTRIRSLAPHADSPRVNTESAAVLKGLAGLGRKPTSRAVAAEAGLDLSTAEDILAALAVVGLVEPAAPGRWHAHPGLRGADAALTVDHLLEVIRHGRPIAVEAPEDQPPPVADIPEPPNAPTPQPPLEDGPKQLTAAARELGVHRDTLDVWAKQGLVPFTWTVGGRRRFLVSEIRAHLSQRAAA